MFSLCTPVIYINKAESNDISGIMLKVALNQTPQNNINEFKYN